MNYFRADLTQVKATNRGGRLHSAVHTKEIPNGVFGFLGGYIAGSTEIRTFEVPTADLIKAKMPVVVMKPEINYNQDRLTDNALGIFRNPANKAFPVVPLEDLDGLDLSFDYFDLTGKTNGKKDEVQVGDMFALQPNDDAGKQLKYSATEPAMANNHCYFKVIGVVDSHIANYVYTDGTATASMFPKPYKMVQLEVIKATK